MEDLEGLKTTDALPGEFPYLRGTKNGMTFKIIHSGRFLPLEARNDSTTWSRFKASVLRGCGCSHLTVAHNALLEHLISAAG